MWPSCVTSLRDTSRGTSDETLVSLLRSLNALVRVRVRTTDVTSSSSSALVTYKTATALRRSYKTSRDAVTCVRCFRCSLLPSLQKMQLPGGFPGGFPRRQTRGPAHGAHAEACGGRGQSESWGDRHGSGLDRRTWPSAGEPHGSGSDGRRCPRAVHHPLRPAVRGAGTGPHQLSQARPAEAPSGDSAQLSRASGHRCPGLPTARPSGTHGRVLPEPFPVSRRTTNEPPSPVPGRRPWHEGAPEARLWWPRHALRTLTGCLPLNTGHRR